MQLKAFGSSLHLLAVLVLLVGGAVPFALLRRLRKKHPETWKKLGEPTLFLKCFRPKPDQSRPLSVDVGVHE